MSCREIRMFRPCRRKAIDPFQDPGHLKSSFFSKKMVKHLLKANNITTNCTVLFFHESIMPHSFQFLHIASCLEARKMRICCHVINMIWDRFLLEIEPWRGFPCSAFPDKVQRHCQWSFQGHAKNLVCLGVRNFSRHRVSGFEETEGLHSFAWNEFCTAFLDMSCLAEWIVLFFLHIQWHCSKHSY